MNVSFHLTIKNNTVTNKRKEINFRTDFFNIQNEHAAVAISKANYRFHLENGQMHCTDLKNMIDRF